MYALDILRIVSMCGIVTLHFLGQGGLLEFNGKMNQYAMAWFLEICAYCSVNLFAMLSGYLCYGKRKFNAHRMIELIGCTLFYTVFITSFFLAVNPAVFNGFKDVVISLFPAIDGRFWYITCFIPLLVLEPFYNVFLEKLTVQQHEKLCIILFVFFSVIPSVFMVDFFSTVGGYSFVWLSICYIFGAYLKRNHSKCVSPKWYIIGFFGCAIFLLAGNMFAYQLFHGNPRYLVAYTSPVVVCMAVCVFRVFENISNAKIPDWMKPVLADLSAVSFDVYILHSHVVIYNNIIQGNFVWIHNYSFVLMPVLLGCAVVLCYFVLALVGKVRMMIFNKLDGVFHAKLVNKLSYSLDEL